MSRFFALGDIHGAAKALEQVLDRSPFDPLQDTVVLLGDVVDGWPETRECVDILLDIPNIIFILGNHDEWFREWMRTKITQPIWTEQGGRATLESYKYREPPSEHVDFFESARDYYLDEERNFFFVHGGWPYGNSPENMSGDILRWNRTLWSKARREQEPITKFDKVFIGHTAIGYEPVKMGDVWNLDTGAGWAGKLTIMDVDTEEYWQSDFVQDLYPEATGRRY